MILKLLRNKTTYATIFSYLLGLGMLPYALTKLLRTQFVILPFHEWSVPLKDLSGVTLTWAFLGYSKWFTILLGVLELLPAVLLLFRKTRLLGAILLLPVVLNVFLINIALDLWQNTQLISGIFLILNILILLLNHSIFIDFVKRIFKTGSIKKLGVEVVINIILIGAVSSLFVGDFVQYIDERNILTGDWYDDRPNYWLVKETTEAGKIIKEDSKYEEDYVRYYFHPKDFVAEFLPGSTQSKNKVYKVDEKNKLLKIYSWQQSDTIKGNYQLLNDTTLVWNLEDGREMKLEKRILR